MTLPSPKMTWRQMVHLAAAKQCQELMVVVRDSEPENAIADYQQRLKIETMFHAMKSRGCVPAWGLPAKIELRE